MLNAATSHTPVLTTAGSGIGLISRLIPGLCSRVPALLWPPLPLLPLLPLPRAGAEEEGWGFTSGVRMEYLRDWSSFDPKSHITPSNHSPQHPSQARLRLSVLNCTFPLLLFAHASLVLLLCSQLSVTNGLYRNNKSHAILHNEPLGSGSVALISAVSV